MSLKPYLTTIAAASFVWASAATASESKLPLNSDPNSLICAAAAAAAKVTRVATPESLAICGRAIEYAKQTHDQLATAYNNRSVLHIVRGEYELALTDSDAALHINRLLPEAIVNRGISLRAMGEVEDSVKACSQALALGMSHPEIAYFNRAIAREQLGDMKGAYSDYLQASEIEPKWDAPKKQLERFNVARPSGELG